VPRPHGPHVVHDAAGEAVHGVHRAAGHPAPAAAVLRPHLHAAGDRVEREAHPGVPPGDGDVGARVHRGEPVLHQLLPVPGAVRTSPALHHPGDAEHPALCGDAASAGAAQAALPGEPEEGVQEAAGDQLHHPDADRGRLRVPAGRDPHRRGHRDAHRELPDH